MKISEVGMGKLGKEKTRNLSGVSYWHGEIPDPATLNKQLETLIGSSPELDKLRQETKEGVEAADAIQINGGMGIGDCVMSLRYARIVAEHYPEKEFHLRVNPAMIGIDFDFPPNCLVENRMTTPVHVDAYPVDFFYQTGHLNRLAPQVERDGYNNFDLRSLIKLYELGINVSKDRLLESILDISPEQLKDIPQDLDMLFAPDAKEMDANTEKPSRSMKSLTLDQWEKIFQQVPKGMKIGILMGTSHPAHSKAVLDMAQSIASKRGFEVEKIETKTLSDVINQILRTKHFVGMDSGTTHLAFEVVAAAKKLGREIKLTEVFNAGLFAPSQYALRGLEDQVKVLIEAAFAGKRVYRSEDISRMDANAVARELFTDKAPEKEGSRGRRLFSFMTRRK